MSKVKNWDNPFFALYTSCTYPIAFEFEPTTLCTNCLARHSRLPSNNVPETHKNDKVRLPSFSIRILSHTSPSSGPISLRDTTPRLLSFRVWCAPFSRNISDLRLRRSRLSPTPPTLGPSPPSPPKKMSLPELPDVCCAFVISPNLFPTPASVRLESYAVDLGLF